MPDEKGRYVAAILGSRDYYPDDEVFASITRLKARHPEGLVVLTKAGAKGVPKVAADNARLLEVEVVEIEAEEDEAGPLIGATSDLNSKILERADTLLAFFHPGPTADLSMTSSSTMNAVRQALGRKVPAFTFHEGRWRVNAVPSAPTLPPDGWTVPAGYKADAYASRCGSVWRPGCGAPILWAENPRGRREPLDRDGRSHLATCPVRAKERRG